MQILSQLRIGPRLAAGFGIVLLLSALGTAYALYQSNATANARWRKSASSRTGTY
jgi:methyl-accepting chemotaxis protein